MKQIIILTLLLMSKNVLISSDLSDSLNNLKNSFNGTGSMLEGMGQTVGVVEGYEYSYRVFNDTPAPIGVATQRITPVLGAKFSGEVKKAAIVQPFKDSGTEFYGQNLYLDVWLLQTDASQKNEYARYGKELIQKDTVIGTVIPGFGSAIGALVGSIIVEKKLEDNEIFHKKIPLGKKDDKNIYFYRAYSNRGKINGEYLGICSTSKDFVGIFFNNSSASNVSLSFMKDTQTYKVLLEPGTFSLLSSTTTEQNSIRGGEKDAPRGFVFSQADKAVAAIPIAPEGIATMQVDPKSDQNNPTFIPGAPYTYTYEVYQDKGETAVGLQGLSIGNHAQTLDAKTPGKSVVRDINPVICQIWAQSASQYNRLITSKDPQNAIPSGYDLTESIWFAYATHDQELYQKLDRGQVATIRILRPLISEKDATFYITALQTKDDASAKKFLQRLCTGKLASKGTLSSSAHADIANALVKPEPTAVGIIDDTPISSTKGWVLLSDTFLPRGTGAGPFYYSILAPTINTDALMNPLTPFLDTTKMNIGTQPNAQDKFYLSTCLGWINDYTKNTSTARDSITKFIANYGVNGITKNNALLKTLTDSLLSGPISLQNIPVTRQAGINHYVYSFDAKPEGWPS